MISNAGQKSVAAIIARHHALATLPILVGDACTGCSNDRALSDVLDALGLGCSHPQLRACLDHLERSGLVTLSAIEGLVVVSLTRDGAEVAVGRARAEGVQPFVAGGPY